MILPTKQWSATTGNKLRANDIQSYYDAILTGRRASADADRYLLNQKQQDDRSLALSERDYQQRLDAANSAKSGQLGQSLMSAATTGSMLLGKKGIKGVAVKAMDYGGKGLGYVSDGLSSLKDAWNAVPTTDTGVVSSQIGSSSAAQPTQLYSQPQIATNTPIANTGTAPSSLFPKATQNFPANYDGITGTGVESGGVTSGLSGTASTGALAGETSTSGASGATTLAGQAATSELAGTGLSVGAAESGLAGATIMAGEGVAGTLSAGTGGVGSYVLSNGQVAAVNTGASGALGAGGYAGGYTGAGVTGAGMAGSAAAPATATGLWGTAGGVGAAPAGIYTGPAFAGYAVPKLIDAVHKDSMENIGHNITLGAVTHEKTAKSVGSASVGGLAGALTGAIAGATATSWSGPGAIVGAVVGAIAGLIGAECIIVTACTNRYSPEVNIAREYRDKYLTQTQLVGYYWIAEKIVPLIENSPSLGKFVKKHLVDHLVAYGKYKLGKTEKKPSIIDTIVSKTFLAKCSLIGTMVGSYTRKNGERY